MGTKRCSITHMIYLDVRSQEEYDEGHITGAVHLDVSDIMQGKVPDCAKDEPITTYCASGSRSAIAEHFLRASGFTHVVNGGGYDGLVRQGGEWEA